MRYIQLGRPSSRGRASRAFYVHISSWRAFCSFRRPNPERSHVFIVMCHSLNWPLRLLFHHPLMFGSSFVHVIMPLPLQGASKALIGCDARCPVSLKRTHLDIKATSKRHENLASPTRRLPQSPTTKKSLRGTNPLSFLNFDSNPRKYASLSSLPPAFVVRLSTSDHPR
jgi:hypothetical protein